MVRVRLVLLAGLVCVCAAGCGGGGKSGGGPAAQTALGRITGVVNASSGAGTRAGGVTVSVDATPFTTAADTDGRFVIDSVPAGLYTLTAIYEDGMRGNAVVVSVESGKETKVGQIDLRDAGQISGIVSSGMTGERLADAVVTIIENVSTLNNEMPHPVRVRHTGADGRYDADGLPVGDYIVTIEKVGYTAVSLSRTVTAGATTSGDSALDPTNPGEGGTVQGTVYLRTEDGGLHPLAGVLVSLLSPGYTDPMPPLPPIYAEGAGAKKASVGDRYCAFTRADGTYLIEGAPAGTYQAVAVRPGLQSEERQLTVTAGGAVTADFTLTLIAPRFGQITGVVTNAATSQPIAGAEVMAIIDAPPPVPLFARSGGGASSPGGAIIMPDPGECRMSAETDGSGHYVLLVPASVTGVQVYASGYKPGAADATVTPGGTVAVNVALQPLGTEQVVLSGKVRQLSAGGLAPVEGATVWASPYWNDPFTARPAVVFSGTTDAGGSYSINLSPGIYEVRAEKGSLSSSPVEVTLYHDATQDLVLQDEMPPPPPDDNPPAPPVF